MLFRSSTSVVKYGTGSMYFNGSGSSSLTAPYNPQYLLNGDFTIEAWVYPTALSSYQGIISFSTSGGWNGWQFTAFNNTLFFEFLTGSAGAGTATTGSVLVNNSWQHIAAVRVGSTITVYVNGVSQATSTYSTPQGTTSSYLGIGVDRTKNSDYFVGYMTDVRVTKGGALYTAAFTPPTAPLTTTVSSGTVSLLTNYTNGGIIDNAMMNDLETVGNAQISTTQSKFGGGSMYFNGSGSYLTFLRTANVQFGSGDWTIELWFYLNSASGVQVLLSGTNGGLTVGSWEIYAVDNGAGGMNFANSSWADYSVKMGSTPSANTWYHLAITRSGTSTRLFLNGTLQNTTTVPSGMNVNGSGSNLLIGAQGNTPGSLPLNGYIDDLRITKGYARYTGNFTPTGPFPTQ